MNIHLAGNPVEAHAFVEVQGGETPTSPSLPRILPSHLSQIHNTTSYDLSLGVMLKCGTLCLDVLLLKCGSLALSL